MNACSARARFGAFVRFAQVSRLAGLALALGVGLALAPNERIESKTPPEVLAMAGSDRQAAGAAPAESLEWARASARQVALELGVPPEGVVVDAKAPSQSAHAQAEHIVVSPELALQPMLLKFVLAHELAHQRLGHTQGPVLREPSRELLVQQEFDADALAVNWVCGAGACNIEPFAQLLERSPAGPRHPSGVERARRVRQAAAGFGDAPRPGFAPSLLPVAPWSVPTQAPAQDSFAMKAWSR